MIFVFILLSLASSGQSSYSSSNNNDNNKNTKNPKKKTPEIIKWFKYLSFTFKSFFKNVIHSHPLKAIIVLIVRLFTMILTLLKIICTPIFTFVYRIFRTYLFVLYNAFYFPSEFIPSFTHDKPSSNNTIPEQDRIRKEKEEQDRIRKEKEEQDRIRKEKEEQDRIRKEKEEQDRIRKEKEEQERKEAENKARIEDEEEIQRLKADINETMNFQDNKEYLTKEEEDALLKRLEELERKVEELKKKVNEVASPFEIYVYQELINETLKNINQINLSLTRSLYLDYTGPFYPTLPVQSYLIQIKSLTNVQLAYSDFIKMEISHVNYGLKVPDEGYYIVESTKASFIYKLRESGRLCKIKFTPSGNEKNDVKTVIIQFKNKDGKTISYTPQLTLNEMNEVSFSAIECSAFVIHVIKNGGGNSIFLKPIIPYILPE